MGLARRAWMLAAFTLALAAPAQAAYAPKLSAEWKPATYYSLSQLVTKVTQASGETANKTVKVVFPAGTTINLYAKVKPCTPEQASSETCPPESQIGKATAESQVGPLNGPVFLIQDNGQFKLQVRLTGLGGLLDITVTGIVTVRPDGRIETVFDNLPNQPTTVFQLDLEGGEKQLLYTPQSCGPATFEASFTSQNGEQAAGTATVPIEGCPSTPVVSGVRADPRRFRAVRTAADKDRRGYGTTLHWTLSEATQGTRVKVQRRVRRSWRSSGSFVATGNAGDNLVRFDGRSRKGPLAAGLYRFVVQTTNNAGKISKPGSTTFTILAPRKASRARVSTAGAPYAPTFSVQLDPPTAGWVPQLTASFTQSALEPPTQRFTLRFPRGFRVNRSLGVPVCAYEDFSAGSCPDISRVGRLDAGGDSGPLYVAEGGRRGAARILGFVQGRMVVGVLRENPMGTLDLSFDGLPKTTLSGFGVVLHGGEYGLVRTAPDCVIYSVDGNFTSWLGDLAVARAELPVTNCVEPVTISAVRTSPRRFRASPAPFTEEALAGFGTVLHWRLSRSTSATRVRVERRTETGWDRMSSLVASGKRGNNVLIFDGRLRGRRLAPGDYRFVLLPAGGSAGAGVRFTVVR